MNNTLNAEKRDMKVKAKKLRREGYIIGNLFGKDMDNSIPLKLDSHDTTMFLKDHKKGAHITLNIDGNNTEALIKEINYNALKKDIEFINFQQLVANEKINATTPVVLLNEDSVQNGIVEQSLSEIEYEAYPADLVEAVEIDLANYKAGDLIYVKDLDIAKNEKISLITSPDTIVVNIAEPEAAPEDDEDAEE